TVRSERDALHIAVPAGVDRRVPRVVLGYGAVHRDAQDLAVEGVVVRGVLGLEGVAGADPEVAVRPDLDPSAVMTVGGLYAVEQDPVDGQGVVLLSDRQRHDAVLPRAGHR